MKITIVGTGYVGLVSGTCFADVGNDVICIDLDEKKVEGLKNGVMPIYEPGLEKLVNKNYKAGRLNFSTDIAKGIKFGDIIFSAVGTPPDKDYRADLSAVKAVAKSFGQNANKFKVFVNKSTVPVGTGKMCKQIIERELKKRKKNVNFEVVSNPEFLREGSAIKDTMKPDRVVVGTGSEKVRKMMEELYKSFTNKRSPLVFTDVESAEIIKYASNSFLATKISFINEIANFCEKAGGNVEEVAKGMGLDSRIGPKFLNAGIGYGGSCFPKDVQALIQTGKQVGYDFKILNAVEDINESQKKKLFNILKNYLPKMEGKTVAVLGLAFKPETDDMRDAPSIKIIKKLQAEGVNVKVYDPVAMENAQNYFSKINLDFMENVYDAVEGADAVLVVTEWNHFSKLDLNKVKKLMKVNIIIDGRNIFKAEDTEKVGLKRVGIGCFQN